MKKIAYLDCFSGISGDMCLGAFVDAGVDLDGISLELRKLPVSNYRLTSKKVIRRGIDSTKVDVIIDEKGFSDAGGRKWADIVEIISSSKLSSFIKDRGLSIFRMLFEAEAKVHGEPYEHAHLHELGAVDCLVDVFGTLIAIDMMEIERFYVSHINLGSGFVNTSHGILPVPAPATIELLRSYPIYSSGIPFELTTPTGAAIISGINATPSPLPLCKIEKVGYGAGNKDIEKMPNVLRILVGQEDSEKHPALQDDTVMIIETNIDDMNPQVYEDVMDRLFSAGALDVALENIIMKKGRPAIKLTVMALERDFESLSEILFRNTTTIGLRYYTVHRKTLNREIKTIRTRLGDIRIKISRIADTIVNIMPEYDDIKTLSMDMNMPVKKIYEIILPEIQKKDY